MYNFLLLYYNLPQLNVLKQQSLIISHLQVMNLGAV